MGKAVPTSSVFKGIHFSLSGSSFSQTQADLTALIIDHSGTVASNVTSTVTHLVATPEDVAKKSAKVKKAVANKLPIVSESFLLDSISAGKREPEKNHEIVVPEETEEKEDKEEKKDKKRKKEVEEDKEEPTSGRATRGRAAKEKTEEKKEEKKKPAAKKGGKKTKAADKEETEEKEEEEVSKEADKETEEKKEKKPAAKKGGKKTKAAEKEVVEEKEEEEVAKEAEKDTEKEAEKETKEPAAKKPKRGKKGAKKGEEPEAAEKPVTETPAKTTETTTTTTTTAETAPATAPAPTDPAAAEGAPVLERSASIVGRPPNQNIEICFSFDTTGSMYPCLTQVRNSISVSVERLFKDIPNIRIAIIAHGDYCDARSTYVTKVFDFSTDKDAITKFVNEVGPSGGGDAPECYELVLRDCRNLKWTAGFTKALVLIGDDLPHEPRDNPEKIDWRVECDNLKAADIKVYAVQALSRKYATNFYRDVAAKTLGIHVNLDQFATINDMFIALCYAEHSADYVQTWEKELTTQGRINRNLTRFFDKVLGREAKMPVSTVDGLNAVHPSRFQILSVPDDTAIKDFAAANGLQFKPGRGFYQFTKTETVQGYKEIVLRTKATGDFFEGPKARELLGLSTNKNAKEKLKPKALEEYDVFVQSTSYTRKLLGGTKFLYEVEDWDK